MALCKLTIETRLSAQGCSVDQIRDANITTSIAANMQDGGNHVVGVVKLSVNGMEEQFIIDPWNDGAIITPSEIKKFYGENRSRFADENANFEKNDRLTDVINDSLYLNAVATSMREIHRIDIDNTNWRAQQLAR